MSCSRTNPQSGFDCETELQRLYNVYMRLISGRNVIQQQDGEYRRVEFGPGDAEAVLQQYTALWLQCGSRSNLPDLRLGAGASTRIRGGPMNADEASHSPRTRMPRSQDHRTIIATNLTDPAEDKWWCD